MVSFGDALGKIVLSIKVSIRELRDLGCPNPSLIAVDIYRLYSYKHEGNILLVLLTFESRE